MMQKANVMSLAVQYFCELAVAGTVSDAGIRHVPKLMLILSS